ncbi:MAG: asparagine synthase (glutamine-hydrolyzing) [Synechococcus sp.]|nr:asparagine synthase (glutamine-hydrolyzing) [Synechococcus sp.]
MCGIAGLITHHSSFFPVEQFIRPMQAALRHRGPDDAGIYLSPNHQVALAHTRLAILDLSDAGHQPMATPDGRYWITFNGEIYNFQELRSELEIQGETFRSHTDTEVILKLYRRYGKTCIQYLQGMFAFAIWDDHEKSCFLARDPLGIKPLYYCQSESTLGFASELRALLASGLTQRQLCPQGLYGYLRTGSVPEPYTLIEGIHCLEAGHWLYWQQGNLKKESYWSFQFNSDQSLIPDAQDRVRQALLDSVKSHYVSDVPVGVFLSGGIDSTALVALSRQMQSSPLHTFSIAFEEAEWNEGDVARQVADYFDTQHTEFMVTADLGRSLLPRFLNSIDQPSIDGFNTFCVSKIAHDAGMKVVLSGLGGDELFGGYQSFRQLPKMLKIGQLLQSVKPVTYALGKSLETWGPSAKLRRIGDFLRQDPTLFAAYHSFRGLFSHAEACQILQVYLPGAEFPPRQVFEVQRSDSPTLADQISILELSRYMRNQLLRDSDVMSMAWGLELRVPLVDRILVETLTQVPSNQRLLPGKQLLIQSVGNIPEFVTNRPKRGFFFPYEQWMQNEWKDLAKSARQFHNIPLTPWYRRWSLIILQHWWQQICS